MEQYDDSNLNVTFNLKITERMAAKIRHLARIEGRSESDVVRDLINMSMDAYGDIFSLQGPVLQDYTSPHGTGQDVNGRRGR